MKTVLTILASVSIFASTATLKADCGTQRRVVGYTRCGNPIIAVYEVIGRSRCGNPIFGWVTHYPEESRYASSYRDHDDYRHHDWDRDRDHDRDEHHHHSHR